MRLTAIAFTAAGLVAAVATAATAAAPQRVSDIDYLKASRCAGLAAAGTLGQVDAAALNDFVKGQERIRAGFVNERARTEHDNAKRQAKHADAHDRLNAELTGPCMAYVEGNKVAAQNGGVPSQN